MRKAWLSKNRYWVLLWMAAIGSFAAVTGNQFISYDESYTMMLIQHSWKDIIQITGLDVHPPLYYLIAKMIAYPFGYALWAVKLVNLFPLCGMLWMGGTFVRKEWGETTGLWFGFLTITLPASQTYLLPELRMYGLASFFVVCCLLMALKLLRGTEDKQHKKYIWVSLFISGIAAAYTQYYALIAVALIYLLLAVSFVIKQKKEWKSWLGCVLASAVCYLPWLLVLLQQLQAVKADYWIPPITLRSMLSYMMFPFYSGMNAAAGLLLAVCMLGILLWGGAWKTWKVHIHTLAFAVAAYIGMIGVGVAVSIAIRPVFSVRYVKCVLGILIFAIAMLASRIQQKKQRVLVCLFAAFAMINAGVLMKQNFSNNEEYEKLTGYVQEHFLTDTVILHEEEEHSMGTFAYLLSEWKQVIPDRFYKDEYEAFRPVLFTRSEYEAAEKSKADLWVIDVGNMQYTKSWDEEQWEVLEVSPFFCFKDREDVRQFVLTHIRAKV